MAKLPVLSGEELLKLLIKDGFTIVRRRGSHISLQKGKYRTVVPLHKELARGTLFGILRQCGLSPNDLSRLMKK